jgi:hypothetical protein
MYRVTLRNAFHRTGTTVLSPTPYPDETWEWMQQEAWDEAFDGRHGPAQRRLERVKRELCGIRGCPCRLRLHRTGFARKGIA